MLRVNMNWYKKAQLGNGNYLFVTTCVSSICEDITDMVDNAEEVTFDEFILYVNEEEYRGIEQSLGYPMGPYVSSLKEDYAVSFWHGTFRGVDAYYFEHSRIEYVFTLNGEVGDSLVEYELV